MCEAFMRKEPRVVSVRLGSCVMFGTVEQGNLEVNVRGGRI